MEKLSNVTSEYEEVLDLHQLLLAQKKAQAKMTPKSPPPHWQWVSSEISRGIMKNDYLDFEFTERLGTRLSEVMGEGPSKEQESREK
ncbi:hypothetical protein HMI55_000186 [Coelomomyces lativittatus]|nr:hypothetical protein HMI55_000186 [Coelomomyces lativittatus]